MSLLRAPLLRQTSLFTLAAAAMVGVASPARAADAADAADADTGADHDDEIVVNGDLAAQRKAIAEKRDAFNTVETLEANDVGKLPDQNVAEAVKRLPGISVANDQGEGRYVIIRGIDPNLVNVTLNGQTLPAPEPDGRVVKLDDLPSAMIQSISVSKSVLPNQDANAIGGSVDIKTKTAFDSAAPFFLDARGSIGYYGLNHKTPYQFDATAGGRFGADEQFGAVVSVNYSRRPIESENYQASEDYTTYNGVPDGNGLRDYNLVRKRLGVVGNFDWHPSDTVKLYLRTSYSKFNDNETRDQNRLAVTSVNGTTGAIAGTATILVRHREEDDNTKSATLGGEFDDVAGGKLEMSGGWTRATKVDPVRSEFTFTAPKGKTAIDYDVSTDPYTMVPSDSALFSTPSAFALSKYNFEHRRSFEQLWQARIDYTHPIALGDDSTFAIGAKYIDRHKADDHDKTDYKAGTAWTLNQGGAYTGDDSFYGDMFNFGTRIDYDAARAYMSANPSVAKIDSAGTLSDSLASDYDVREKITAGYIMATLRFGGLTVVPGVRIEHTEDSTSAKAVDDNSTLDEGFNVFGHQSYTDLFPGINAKYDFGNNLVARAAVTTSIGRPNYPDLAPYVVVEDDTVPNVSMGNPNLKPLKAVSYDASLEYYPTAGALFSAGVFHKSIDNPIYTYNTRQTDVTIANVLYAAADVASPINASSEQLTGVEFNAQMQFVNLPGFWSGFGVSANYTHVWGHADADFVRDGGIPLIYQSKNVANAQIFYEKYGFGARLALNYRSAYLDLLGADASTDEYTDGNAQLDLHLSYQITPQFSVFGDAINLTDAPWRRYVGVRQQLVEREQYGAQYRIGVQLHF
ncbi:TonB-dependent receptor [Novosphingobium sp. PhB165]|uniref:TonB-dependent receptor n=1 Tax=Novosphingobium sp. PhB165 TaxID=2485105 RepID=UPI0010E3E5A8|nr:TonB-dependent receptor [Novosphingobium sp. PhB165]TCM19385.1 TonB-dependent receptor [Novosphingobium sp. PhB165]